MLLIKTNWTWISWQAGRKVGKVYTEFVMHNALNILYTLYDIVYVCIALPICICHFLWLLFFMLTTYVRNFPKMKISLLRVFVRVKSQCLYNYRLKGTHDPEGEALCKGPECLELTALWKSIEKRAMAKWQSARNIQRNENKTQQLISPQFGQ